MDTALLLRMSHEEGVTLSTKEIDAALENSVLVQKIISKKSDNYLFNIFKLIGLAEIPGVLRLAEVKQLVNFINKRIATSQGFSYTGLADGIVPCYNALLLEAYARLGLAETKEAQNALNWIKSYQLFTRNQETSWTGKGICRHGGCLKATPCFIGIGKTVRALITYQDYAKKEDPEVTQLIAKGTDYMLSHQMFLRLSEDKPISPHITESTFPQSYVLSLTDLVYIIGKTASQSDPRSQKLVQLIQEKQVAEGQGKIDYIYSYQGYTSFETRRKASEWLSFLYTHWLTNKATI